MISVFSYQVMPLDFPFQRNEHEEFKLLYRIDIKIVCRGRRI